MNYILCSSLFIIISIIITLAFSSLMFQLIIIVLIFLNYDIISNLTDIHIFFFPYLWFLLKASKISGVQGY